MKQMQEMTLKQVSIDSSPFSRMIYATVTFLWGASPLYLFFGMGGFEGHWKWILCQFFSSLLPIGQDGLQEILSIHLSAVQSHSAS